LRDIIHEWLALARDEQEAYLRWHVLHISAAALPAQFAQEDFHYYGTVLHGIQEMEPRWKRCTQLTNDALGEAVGRSFVKAHFPREAKERALVEIRAIQSALRNDISGLEWMSDATKKEALRKLEAFRIKVAYPDRWRDYSGLQVRAGDTLGNLMRAQRF